MEEGIYLDACPLGDEKYLVAINDQTENTISVIGTNDMHYLRYRNLESIEDIPIGDNTITYDDDGNKCQITRLK